MSDQPATTRPEKEFPAGRGAKVAVWLNASGRSITVSPPRYKDQQGAWRDGSFFVNDLAMLIFALQQALAFSYSAATPSMDNDPVN